MNRKQYSHIRDSRWFAMVIVIVLLMISIFIITSSWHILGILTKNEEFSRLDSEAQNLLANEREFFQNALVSTNTNGGGYSTNGASREDENHDDDDFHGEKYDTDGDPDDDGTAFSYKFGFVLPDRKENILFINKKYTDITGFTASSLSGFDLFLSQNALCTVEIYDGNIYGESGKFVLKTRKLYDLQSSKNFVPIPSDTFSNDLIVMFITNDTHETLSYFIGWMDLQGEKIEKFMPANNEDRNIDLYANIILEDKDGKYVAFENTYYNILPGGKKPISPTYLHVKNSTGATMNIEWDINDKTNTGAYYLYRSPDASVDCRDQYFFQKIPLGYKENNTDIPSDPWIYYYVLCASNSAGSGNGIENMGKLSPKSNTLQIIK